MVSAQTPSVEHLELLLRRAAAALDEASREIRTLGFHPDTNLERIGEALVHILDIQDELYSIRPDLMPDDLNERRG